MANAEPASGWDANQHLQLLVTLHWVATGLFGLAFLLTSFTIGLEWPFISFAVLPLLALHAGSAMGLTQRESWGRTMSMVTAGISILGGLPGIAFAIYAFIVHARADVKAELTGGNP